MVSEKILMAKMYDHKPTFCSSSMCFTSYYSFLASDYLNMLFHASVDDLDDCMVHHSL